jgi:hypothetical protein
MKKDLRLFLHQKEPKGRFKTTIIIASVAITLAVAAGFFLVEMGSIKATVLVGVKPVSVSRELNGSYWVINVILENERRESLTLVQAMVNGTEVDNYASPYVPGQTSTDMYRGQVLRRGEKVIVRFFLDPNTYYTSPRTRPWYKLMFINRSGVQYPTEFILA